MLKIEIVDPTCTEGEAYVFSVPLGTEWFRIEAAVKLFYPEATCVAIYQVEEEE